MNILKIINFIIRMITQSNLRIVILVTAHRCGVSDFLVEEVVVQECNRGAVAHQVLMVHHYVE